jgi:hypothetical protein
MNRRMSRTSTGKAHHIAAEETDGRTVAIAAETVAGAEAVRVAVDAEAVEDAAGADAAAAGAGVDTVVATADMEAEEEDTNFANSVLQR